MTQNLQNKKEEEWETELEFIMEDCRVVHVYDTEQYKKIRTLISKVHQSAKQEGRDSLLKELGLTGAWNMTEIKSIQEAERNRIIEVIEEFEKREDWGKGFWLSAVRDLKSKIKE